MKTLVNKQNPQIRITAPEFKMNEYGRWYTPDETRKTVELTPENWTLIEGKPVDIIKEIDRYFGNYKDPVTKEKYRKSICWLNHRQAIKFARHFYELGKKVGSK